LIKATNAPAFPAPRRKRGLFMKAFLLTIPNNPLFEEVFTSEVLEAIRTRVDLDDRAVTPENLGELLPALQEAEVLLGTWGFPTHLASELARLPALKLVLYAGGSVKPFAEPFLRRGIPVIGARSANAVPVAEFTLAQIILSNKGYFRNTRLYSNPGIFRDGLLPQGPGNYRQTVALLGYGSIGRQVRRLVRNLELDVLVNDPTLSAGDARREEVTLVSLEDAFSRANVVSCHLPNLPSLHRVIGAAHFEAMPGGATFINTGRGMQVDEAALADVFARRDDLTALLDVTDPEPPAAESPLYRLPNVRLSSHISGAIGTERERLTNLILEELDRARQGLPLRHLVTVEELPLLA